MLAHIQQTRQRTHAGLGGIPAKKQRIAMMVQTQTSCRGLKGNSSKPAIAGKIVGVKFETLFTAQRYAPVKAWPRNRPWPKEKLQMGVWCYSGILFITVVIFRSFYQFKLGCTTKPIRSNYSATLSP